MYLYVLDMETSAVLNGYNLGEHEVNWKLEVL